LEKGNVAPIRLIRDRERKERTMAKVTEQTVKVKVTKHPREMFYEGRSTRDHMSGMMEYLNGGPTVPDPKLIKRFVKGLKVGDTVGVEHNQYRVEQVTKENFVGVDLKTKKEMDLTPELLTIAIGSGFAEVLYRNGKPYGIELEREVKIKIVNHTKEDEPKEE
jgi:hypothetical protein